MAKNLETSSSGNKGPASAASTPRRRLPLYRKALYGIAPLLVLLVLAEVICRLLPDQTGSDVQTEFVVPDEELLWRLRPHSEGTLATNALGLRDTPYKAGADVKILLLGDSVSWGDGIRDLRLVYPYLLEERLARKHAPQTFEVINAGVPGYSTFQEAIYLKKHGLALKPDLVILQFCLNDVVERYHTLSQYGGDDSFLGIDTRKKDPGLWGFAMRHSRAFSQIMRFVQRRARDREAYDVQKLTQDQLSPPLTEAWMGTLREIEDIRSCTQEHGIPLLLVIAPYQFQLSDPIHLRQPQDRLLQFAAEKHIPAVDLLPGMAAIARQRGVPPAQLFNDPSHFSVFGHEVAAELLAEPVRGALSSGHNQGRGE